MSKVSLVRGVIVGFLSIAVVGTACGGEEPAEPFGESGIPVVTIQDPTGVNASSDSATLYQEREHEETLDSTPGVELPPYCVELQTMNDELIDIGTSADGGLGQMVAIVNGLKSLDDHLARLQDKAVGDVVQSFANVRRAIDQGLSTFSIGDSLDNVLAYVLLQGVSLLPDLEAIDHYTVRECGGGQIFGLSGEQPIPVSPRPTDDGLGIIIDSRNIYGKEFCDSLSIQKRPIFEDTLTVQCDSSSLLLFSTATWDLIDTAEYPTGVRNVTSGGPTIAATSEMVIPASGLDPERVIERLHIWQRGREGFTDPVEIETSDTLRGVTANGGIVLGDDLISADNSKLATRPGGWRVLGSYLVAVDEHLVDRRIDLQDLLSNDRSDRPLVVLYDDLGGKISDFTPEVAEISNELGRFANVKLTGISICGDTVLLSLDHWSPGVNPRRVPSIVTDLRTGLTSQVPDVYVHDDLDRYMLTPHGVVIYSDRTLSGFSADGGLWSVDLPEGLVDYTYDGYGGGPVFSFGGRPIVVNSSREYLEFDSESGELLEVSDELFRSSSLVYDRRQRATDRFVDGWYIRNGKGTRGIPSTNRTKYELELYEIRESACQPVGIQFEF